MNNRAFITTGANVCHAWDRIVPRYQFHDNRSFIITEDLQHHPHTHSQIHQNHHPTGPHNHDSLFHMDEYYSDASRGFNRYSTHLDRYHNRNRRRYQQYKNGRRLSRGCNYCSAPETCRR